MPYLTYAPTLAAIEQTKLQAKQKKGLNYGYMEERSK